MSYQEDPANNQLHVFIPKCKLCKSSLLRYDIRGIVKQTDIDKSQINSAGTGNLQEYIDSSSIAPAVTHLKMQYRCPKHFNVVFDAPLNMIDKMNEYPAGRIIYHHVEF